MPQLGTMGSCDKSNYESASPLRRNNYIYPFWCWWDHWSNKPSFLRFTRKSVDAQSTTAQLPKALLTVKWFGNLTYFKLKFIPINIDCKKLLLVWFPMKRKTFHWNSWRVQIIAQNRYIYIYLDIYIYIYIYIYIFCLLFFWLGQHKLVCFAKKQTKPNFNTHFFMNFFSTFFLVFFRPWEVAWFLRKHHICSCKKEEKISKLCPMVSN